MTTTKILGNRLLVREVAQPTQNGFVVAGDGVLLPQQVKDTSQTFECDVVAVGSGDTGRPKDNALMAEIKAGDRILCMKGGVGVDGNRIVSILDVLGVIDGR